MEQSNSEENVDDAGSALDALDTVATASELVTNENDVVSFV